MLRGKAASTRGLRRKYRNWVGKDWPYDDTYLRELTRESDTMQFALELMRECHVF